MIDTEGDQMTMHDDYTEADRWDWDYTADDQHCEHGTFIGSWWGPDLMCQWCEAGITPAEVEQIEQVARIEEATSIIRRMERLVKDLCDSLGIAKGTEIVSDFCADDPDCVWAYKIVYGS